VERKMDKERNPSIRQYNNSSGTEEGIDAVEVTQRRYNHVDH
jgi:hypothetical protein